MNNIRNNMFRLLDLLLSNLEEVKVTSKDEGLQPEDTYYPALALNLSIEKKT